ncbi:MAG TPA: hypothetical protein PLN35_14960, partial [Quisquiliibacterium sp.]|nr:hypothetical protein [Quisquiliibacterium sp.]
VGRFVAAVEMTMIHDHGHLNVCTGKDSRAKPAGGIHARSAPGARSRCGTLGLSVSGRSA